MNKKIFSLSLIIILFIILLLTPTFVNAKTMSLRNSASNTARILAEINTEESVKKLSEQGDFYKVSYENLGYINKSKISKISRLLTKLTLRIKGKITLSLSANADSVSGSTVLANIKSGQKVIVYKNPYNNFYICGYKATGYILKTDIDGVPPVEEENPPVEEENPPVETEDPPIEETPKTILYNNNGTNYVVPNTKNSLSNLISKIKKTNIQQGAKSEYSDCCLGFAYHYSYLLTYANSLDEISGTTAIEAQQNSNSSHYFGKHTSNVCNDSKQAILNTIYDNINNGKPCVLQVNGRSDGSSRHYVVAVGYNARVQSKEDLKESDIMILDTYSANLKILTVQPGTLSKRFMITGYQTGRTGRYGYGYQVYTLN